MSQHKIKIYLLIVAGVLAAGLAYAADPTPPKLPVLYYGTASINNQLATTSPVITMRRKADGREIASTTAAASGKYFVEMPCSDNLGQTLVFRIGNLIAHEAACVDAMSVPSVNLNLNFNSANQTVENTVSEITIPASISDSTETQIHFTATSTAGDETSLSLPDGLTLTRESAVAANNFIVTISPNTVITGSGAWDGTLIAPSLATINLSIPADPSYVSQAEKIISLGYGGESLTFSRPVSIFFPGQANRQVGFSSGGADFTEITAICPENSAASLTSTASQECKFNGQTDLTVWTKHFTYFAVYRQVYVPPPSRGGGGMSLPEIKPALATTTSPEIIASSNLPAIEPAVEPVAEPQVSPQVLGVKYYANGTLIRGHDKKIYLISNNKLIVIRTLAQLKPFKNQKIYDVADEVIRQYLDFFDGDLIRGPDKKIYVIFQGKLKRLKNLQELKPYAGKKIHDVSQEILAKFTETTVLKTGVPYFPSGSLIRGKDGKIYLISADKLTVIRTLAQLAAYKGRKISDVSDPVIRQYMSFTDGQLVRGLSDKVYVIKNNKKQLILSLEQLKKYAGRPIYQVSEEILMKY